MTMTKEYILDPNNINEEAINYVRRSYSSLRSLKAVQEKLGHEVRLYCISRDDAFYIAKMYTQGKENIEILLYVDPSEPTVSIKGEGIFPNMGNTIFYDKEYNIAIGWVSRHLVNQTDYESYLFAKSDEEAKTYLDLIRTNQRKMEEKEIVFITDKPKGPFTERKKINHSVKREEVVLEPKIKEEIFTLIDGFFEENNNFFKKYNIPYRRGLLLHGKPGNGKTTLVKAIVGSISAPVIYWQVNEYTNSESINEVFSRAENLSPVVLVIEDLDSLPDPCRSTFLNKLDGATEANGIFLIGTTNYPERVDSALKNRPGRFDRVYEIELPNKAMRLQYMLQRGYIDFVTLEEIDRIVAKSENFSFVQLNEIFISMAFSFHTTGKTFYEDIIDQIKKSNACDKKNTWAKDESDKVGFSH